VAAGVGYFLGLSWCKATNYYVDENGNIDPIVKSFLLKMFGGIAILLTIAGFIFTRR
jgi:hypothetical protein